MEIIKIDKKLIKQCNFKSFSIHETNRDFADLIKHAILNHKHFENMLIILMREAYKNKHYEILNLLQNKIIMKAISQQTKGGKKTKEDIEKVREYFKNNELFHAMTKFSKENLNGHNASMIVERLKKDWKNSLNKRKEYFENPSLFSGKPQFPKPKKLQKVFSYSVPLEPSKFSLKNLSKKRLGITLGKRQMQVFLNDGNKYLEDKNKNKINI